MYLRLRIYDLRNVPILVSECNIYSKLVLVTQNGKAQQVFASIYVSLRKPRYNRIHISWLNSTVQCLVRYFILFSRNRIPYNIL